VRAASEEKGETMDAFCLGVSVRSLMLIVPRPPYEDPRFDVTSGTFNEDSFKKAYAFLGEYREEEIRQLRAAVAAAADDEERTTAKAALSRLLQQRTEDARKAAVAGAVREHKKGIAERVAQGAKPFFPKRRDLKEIAATAQFSSLEAKGGAGAVDRALAKRRRKLSGKSKAAMPPPSRRAAPGSDGPKG
jgi:ribosomal RNA-processing protein 36